MLDLAWIRGFIAGSPLGGASWSPRLSRSSGARTWRLWPPLLCTPRVPWVSRMATASFRCVADGASVDAPRPGRRGRCPRSSWACASTASARAMSRQAVGRLRDATTAGAKVTTLLLAPPLLVLPSLGVNAGVRRPSWPQTVGSLLGVSPCGDTATTRLTLSPLPLLQRDALPRYHVAVHRPPRLRPRQHQDLRRPPCRRHLHLLLSRCHRCPLLLGRWRHLRSLPAGVRRTPTLETMRRHRDFDHLQPWWFFLALLRSREPRTC